MFTDETGIGPIESVKMGENARERERERDGKNENRWKKSSCGSDDAIS